MSKEHPGSWQGRRNRIQCLHCATIIEATHEHDFKYCECGEVAIDGGFQGHWRRIWSEGGPEENYRELP